MPRSATHLQISEIEAGILLMTLNTPNSNANILNQDLFAELDQAMAELADRGDVEGLIVQSVKPTIFIAGADLKAIVATLDWSDEQIIQFCQRGRAVMARFSRCPFVTVAAIQGACVGGGLELALWCDRRIVSDHPRTLLGLPEVKLGLVPGWGGTARLPRQAGFSHAAELITSGRLITAQQAIEYQFVDAVVSPDQLISTACDIIRRESHSRAFVEDRRIIMGPVPDLSQVTETAIRLAEQIVASREVFPFAPTVVLEHLVRTAPLEQADAWKSESHAMAQVYGSPANCGLLNHFFLVDRNRKQPGLVDLSLASRPIQTVGIVGAGVMGRSIAENCLQRGVSVLIFDANIQLAQDVALALRDNETAVAVTLREVKISASTPSTPTIQPAQAYADFTNVDLVIESVVENVDVKTGVLRNIESVVTADTLIASNTSAIPIETLAESLHRPENFCGIHFCHPELMSLVEVICGPRSSEASIAKAVGFVRQLEKMAVAMNDGAGFVVNRLLAAMLDQSFRLLTQGVPLSEIDEAMRDFGFLGGPFEIIDVIGADTCLYAGRTMWESGLRCVTLSPILPRMVKLGRLGRKRGVGFYRYPDPRGPRQTDDQLYSVIGSYLKTDVQAANLTTDGTKSSIKTSEQIVQQVLSAMVLEATHILDESIVADFRDLELCVIHGFGFPQHRGGVLFWADTVGLKTVNQTLYEIAENEPRMEPSEMLKTMRLEKRSFYSS